MMNYRHRKPQEIPEWARDIPWKRFSTPYNFTENLRWIWNNLVGPSQRYKELTSFMP